MKDLKSLFNKIILAFLDPVVIIGLIIGTLIYHTYISPSIQKPNCCDQRIKQLQKSFDSTHSKCFRYVSEKEGWR